MYKLEDFKPVSGYEEFYIVNKNERVISLDRKINSKGIQITLKRKNPVIKMRGQAVYALHRGH